MECGERGWVPDGRLVWVVSSAVAGAAGQMFPTLMGAHVEPSRDFVETNALSVVDLDV